MVVVRGVLALSSGIWNRSVQDEGPAHGLPWDKPVLNREHEDMAGFCRAGL